MWKLECPSFSASSCRLSSQLMSWMRRSLQSIMSNEYVYNNVQQNSSFGTVLRKHPISEKQAIPDIAVFRIPSKSIVRPWNLCWDILSGWFVCCLFVVQSVHKTLSIILEYQDSKVEEPEGSWHFLWTSSLTLLLKLLTTIIARCYFIVLHQRRVDIKECV